MARRGKECNTCHKGDEVIAKEIYPYLWAIECKPYPEVEKKNP
jgi:cytochrome c2